MAKKNKICSVCGEQYFYCYDCNVADPSWKGMFHDENCKKIFETINRLFFQHISKEEARNILQQCDLTVLDKENANEKLAKIVRRVMDDKPEQPVVTKKNKRQSKEKSDYTIVENTDSISATKE